MKSVTHQRSGARVPSAAAAETLIPSPSSHKQQRSPRVIYKENIDPTPAPPDPSPIRPSAKPLVPKNIRSPLPPRPPTNPLKRKLNLETLPEHGSPASDDLNVQVVVRMRPSDKDDEQGDHIVQRISPNSISILDHTFTFDSVAGTTSTQQDIYQLVGFPLVENCLAGFNSSIFAYGQTGSGKTYTMWGPPSALSDDDLSSSERGLTPRVFDRLFARINEEQAKHADRKLNYQCRCSFLEIYNEQITDLLDPLQRNLQIREDVRTGVYVDSLKEEYVYTMKDVNQLLIKGLSNRRTGATSINAESSRSHCVFTCIVESRSKSMADGLSSLRTSRINLVDLAGSERQKMTGAAGDRLKEAGNINRSLSQLGNLINILAEVSQSGKQRHIPYRDSKLTFLLQDSLGGNAKLAMICAISPSQSCKSETFSTLRFAQRAKAIKNKAVVNEVTQDDVNVLREQIRQLKDELLRMKSNGGTPDGTYSTGWNARRSLNLLKMSLNRPTILPVLKDDSDEEMEIDEDDVERSNNQAIMQTLSSNDKLCVTSKGPRVSSSSAEELQPTHSLRPICDSNQVYGEVAYIAEDCESKEITLNKVYPGSEREDSHCPDNAHDDSSKLHIIDEKDFALKDNNCRSESYPLKGNTVEFQDSSIGRDFAIISVPDSSNMSSSPLNSSISLSSLSIVPCETSPVLHSPTLSVSPVLESYSRKSIRTSSSTSASQKSIENAKSESGALNISFVGISDNKRNLLNTSFIQTSRNSLAPTECIAATLQRGLQVIENHQHGSSLRRSSFRFSTRPIDLRSLGSVSKVSVGVQTLQESVLLSDSSAFICSYCKSKASAIDAENIVDEMNLQLVPIDAPESSDKPKKFVPKAVEKVLAGSIRREMALEDHCTKQAAEISQLNRLVQQYKHERECNAVIEQTREDKISRLEVLMDGILPTEEFMEEEFISLTNEQKILREKYENHPEILRVNIELKRVQAELDAYRNFFDLGEKDVLMEEIQDLRSQLQYYMDSSSMSARNPSPLIKMNHSTGPISATHGTIPEVNEASADDKLEQERRRWTEAESKWISLSEDLKLELEANRSLAQKWKLELESERKCAEELKEALQAAMEGHGRVLEQYADLQEKHIALHGRHREISNGIEDVKRAAAKAGVKGAESRFINSLAAEISALRVEREKERQFWRDENRGLQTQLRDTAEAVQAAGELLVRLKEAEEAATIAERRAGLAELETEKAYQEIDNLKKNYDSQIITLKQLLAKLQLPKETQKPTFNDADVANCDGDFEPYSHGGDVEFSRGTEPFEWYSGYDRCNI